MTSRLCPTCKTALIEKNFQGEVVDSCSNCGGIYFDKGELENILQIVRYFQEVYLNEKDIEFLESREISRQLECPNDSVLMEKKDILGYTIDVCPSCFGIWLDDREIVALKAVENHIKRNLNLYIRLA